MGVRHPKELAAIILFFCMENLLFTV